MSSPQDVTLTTLAGTTVAQAISDLSSQVANNTTLKAAGITLTTGTAGDALVFPQNRSKTPPANFVFLSGSDKLDHGSILLVIQRRDFGIAFPAPEHSHGLTQPVLFCRRETIPTSILLSTVMVSIAVSTMA